MAKMSNIDSEQIISTASSMEKEISVVKSCAAKFTDAIMALDKQWQSEAKAALMESYNSDLDAINEVAEQMMDFCNALKGMANTYDQSEKDVADKIRNLPKI